MRSPPLLPAYTKENAPPTAAAACLLLLRPNKPVSKSVFFAFLLVVVTLLSLATAFLLAAPLALPPCDGKHVFLEDLAPWIQIPSSWVQHQGQLLAMQPSPPTVSASGVVDRMNEGLGSGDVANGNMLRVYLREDLPGRLRYSGSDWAAPIIGLVEEGYTVVHNRSSGVDCEWASFVNVEAYDLVKEILGIL